MASALLSGLHSCLAQEVLRDLLEFVVYHLLQKLIHLLFLLILYSLFWAVVQRRRCFQRRGCPKDGAIRRLGRCPQQLI